MVDDLVPADAVAPTDPVTDLSEAGVPRGGLPQWIYQRIRLEIITGGYPGGMRLNEQRLTEALSVSRVPLRESFLRLQHDGFIEQQPRRSAVVSGWDAKRVNDLFEARIGIEVQAVELATRRISQGLSTGELERMITHSREALHRGDPLGVAESSTSFHQLVVAATGNDLLVSLMGQLAQRMTWLFYLTSSRDTERACAEHHELIEVMASGNVNLARSVAHAHIEKGRAPSLAVLLVTDACPAQPTERHQKGLDV